MSADKLQALDEALADAFAESPLISAHRESSPPAFDHEALSGIFGESPPSSTNTQPSHPNFDQETFAGMLSQYPPISTDTKPAHQALDQKALAEILSQPLPISTLSRPSRPTFDQGHLAEILSQPSTDRASTKASPAGFDHPALAEMLSEPQPVPINPQLSPFGLDEGPTSAPLSGQVDNEEPAAKTVVVTPSTGAEDARPQRTKSLLAKLHHIFSTKAEPPSGLEQYPLSPSGQRHKQEPVTEAIAAASRSNDEDAGQQQAASKLTELPSPGLDSIEFAEKTSQPDNLQPTASTAPTDAKNAGTPQEWPSLTEPHLISINREASSATRDKETSRRPVPGQPDNLEPAAEMAAVALSANIENTLPQRAASLLTAEAPAPDSETKSLSTADFPTPSRAPRSDNLGPAASIVAGPAKPPLQLFEKEPSRPDPASKAVSVAPPPDVVGAVTREQQTKSPLAELDLNTAIHLRWVMRDIRSARTKLSPPSENDLTALVELGLVEVREGLPRLTAQGVFALD